MDYTVIWERRIKKGLIIRIGFDPNEELPWVISFYGNGKYFLTMRECLAYGYGRGFINTRPEVDRIAAEISRNMKAAAVQEGRALPG